MSNKKSIKVKAGVKALSAFLAVIMLITTIPMVIGSDNNELIDNSENTITEFFTVSFSEPTIVSQASNLVDIVVDGADDTTLNPGAPMLPKKTVVIDFPLGTIIDKVEFEHSSFNTIYIDEGSIVTPGPIPVLQSNQRQQLLLKGVANIASRIASRMPKGQEITTEPIDLLNDDIYNSQNGYGENFGYIVYVGRNEDGELSVSVVSTISPCVFSSVSNGELSYFTEGKVSITYNPPASECKLGGEDQFDLLIISANSYINELKPLVAHKESTGFSTKLVSLSDVYDGVYFDVPEESRDNQEKIKYFIYNAALEWSVDYVMAVGGYRTFIGLNIPSMQFPIRYSHHVDGEPGHVTDHYYSCFLKEDRSDPRGFSFDSWDSNGNDIFAEWDNNGYDEYDPILDVYFGRLACRNKEEVQIVVNKIIYYENNTYGEEWFNKILTVTGDDFQDMNWDNQGSDLDVEWNTTDLSQCPGPGDYTIYAQTKLKNSPYTLGPIDQINITVDPTAHSTITFGEDDHLTIEPLVEGQTNRLGQECLYPGKPVAEIVVPQEGNILGNTDVNFNPPEAYISDFFGWGEVSYNDGVMIIKSKSYDPSANEGSLYQQGSHTLNKVWIDDINEDTIFMSDWKPSNIWYEGEVVANKAISILDDFEDTKLFTSNGNFNNMTDALTAWNEGHGFVYYIGHSCVMNWMNHYPAIPGGRIHGGTSGLATINLKFNPLGRYAAKEGDPLFPMDSLSNGNKLPILLLCGCHSGQFDTSLMRLFYDPYDTFFGHNYATWTPEGMAWWAIRIPQGGAIATIGNTGLGSGYIGNGALSGLGGWIYPRLLYNYDNGYDILGVAVQKTLYDYSCLCGGSDDLISSKSTRKMFEIWNLLGDPTLRMGGCPPTKGGGDGDSDSDNKFDLQRVDSSSPINNIMTFQDNGQSGQSLGWGGVDDYYRVTYNPNEDVNPESMYSNSDGDFLVGYEAEKGVNKDIHPGFAFSKGGSVWGEAIYSNPYDSGHTSIYSWKDGDDHQHVIGSVSFGGGPWGVLLMPDPLDPSTWSEETPWAFTANLYPGRWGLAVTGHTDDEGSTQYGGVWTAVSQGTGFVFADWIGLGIVDIISEISHIEYTGNFGGDCDQSNGWHFWVYDYTTLYTKRTHIVRGQYGENFIDMTVNDRFNPSVAAENGHLYIMTMEASNDTITCMRSSDNGETWDISWDITGDEISTSPKVVIDDLGHVYCYYIRNGNIFMSKSTDYGATWTEIGKTVDVDVDESVPRGVPFVVTNEGLVFVKTPDPCCEPERDLYADIFIPTVGMKVNDIELDVTSKAIITSVTNTGTTDLDPTGMSWMINISGVSPLGKFFGMGEFLSKLFAGRILDGGVTEGNFSLNITESKNITSDPVFGIGHIMVTISVMYDGDVIMERSEDGFLLGGRIFLYHGVE